MSDTLSLYNASVPGLVRMMDNLEHLLRKGEENAKSREIDTKIYLNSRLAPDMFALNKQVQVAASLAKACPFRLAGLTPPVYDDIENASFEDLYALLERTRKDMLNVTPEQLDARETIEFSVKMGPNERTFTGIAYLSGFTIPNVYFHIATSYNILRQIGVPLGKLDYFGGPSALS